MKTDLADNLKIKFPKIFTKPVSIDCGDGWYNILVSLCHTVEFHLEYLPLDLKDQIYVTTVKQKFGGLRFYLNHNTPYLDGAISMAEGISYTTCETCGNVGKNRNSKGYVYVACDDHIIKR